jgi:AcrR family transcriptional regulator
VSSTNKETRDGQRAYNATNRRERADRERRVTRLKVVEAAGRLFVAKGYTATTMADISREAGVAMASVYKAGRSKAQLLHQVVDLAVAGDDEDVKIHERPTYQAIAAESDPRHQVEMLASIIATIQERSAPIQAAYRDAAATDATVAASLRDALERRHETVAMAIGMLPADRLRHSLEDSTDSVWAIGSTEVFLLLRTVRGWDSARYLTWLEQTLIDQLLSPA